MTELYDWLNSRRDDGKRLGTGEFTVSLSEAVRKLAKFGLESREKGILRLVQMAVARNVKESQFKFGKITVGLEFRGLARGAIDLSNLSQDLNASSNNFTLALLACIHSGFSTGRVTQEEFAWHFDVETFRRVEPPEAPSPHLRVEFTIERQRTFRSFLRSCLAVRCLDYAELRRGLCCAPIPVKLDALVAVPHWAPGSSKAHLSLTGPEEMLTRSVAPIVAANIGRPIVASKSRTLRAALSYFGESAPESSEKGPLEVTLATLFVLPSKSINSNQVFLVRDGVVVDVLKPKLRLAVCGSVSAHGLDVAISGLGVVKNHKWRELWAYLVSQLEQVLGSSLQPRASSGRGKRTKPWTPAKGEVYSESVAGSKGMAQIRDADFMQKVESVKRNLK